ncbi:MAG: RES domain-containing protein [Nitrospira sp.]|nr:MAG: RES domain-containing protein [Nitrospira sp.]
MVSRNYPWNDTVACHRCFTDKHLGKWIKDQGNKGRCQWCGARNAYVVDLARLGALFEPIVKCYPSDSSSGDLLHDLLQNHWRIFSDRILAKDLGRDFITAIMTAGVDPKELMALGVDYGGLFLSRHPYHSTLEDIWEERADFGSIFDPDEDEGSKQEYEDEGYPRLDQIQFAIKDRGTIFRTRSSLYRARVYTDRSRRERFTLEEMGAPPPDKTPAQRANRKGEPVMYMATDLQTALAEVRAWKGAPISIAKMRTTNELNILDLTKPYHLDTPFFHESLQWNIETNGLMNRFAEELSRPVMPHEAEVLYRPTQHLCDLVRAAGCDGIAYPSAMGPGHNVVLFDSRTAVPEELSHHRVDGLTFKARNLGQYESPHEEVNWVD